MLRWGRGGGGVGGAPDAVGDYHLSRANSDHVKRFKQLDIRRNGGSTVERVGFIICDDTRETQCSCILW